MMRMTAKVWATGVVLLAQLAFIAPASAKDEFLPPERAYRYTTRVEGERVIVAWTIEPGYYLYKKKMGVVSAVSTAQLGEPLLPKGEDHTDEFFGTQEIRSAGPVHDSRRASGKARARIAAAGLRGCGPVLSAAEVADGSRVARGRQKRRRRLVLAVRQKIRRGQPERLPAAG